MFLGTGEPEEEEAFAEYMAPIAVPGYESDLAVSAARCIANDSSINFVDFCRVTERQLGPLVSELCSCWGVDSKRVRKQDLGASYRLSAGSESALSSLSSRQRNGLRRKWDKLHRLGAVEVRVAKDEHSLRELFDLLVELHEERWRRVGRGGVFRSGVFHDFHRDLAARLLDHQELLLYGVFFNDEPLAVNYCLRSRDCIHYYQGGVNLGLVPKLSPGVIAHLYGSELSEQMGVAEYDLMLGSAASYKARIGVRNESLVSWSLSRSLWPLVLGRLRATARRMLKPMQHEVTNRFPGALQAPEHTADGLRVCS
jgi:CelD/BcsL family acetyltransferase involved in cellulose biosynthesis